MLALCDVLLRPRDCSATGLASTASTEPERAYRYSPASAISKSFPLSTTLVTEQSAVSTARISVVSTASFAASSTPTIASQPCNTP